MHAEKLTLCAASMMIRATYYLFRYFFSVCYMPKNFVQLYKSIRVVSGNKVDIRTLPRVKKFHSFYGGKKNALCELTNNI